jgi:hypothetical protein
MKWVFAAGGVGFVGYAVWQYLQASAEAALASRRKREPWDVA